MAKLQAPLFSLGASGAIGKAIVFFGWKGLNVARQYVVPSNPKSDDQVTQRDYVTAAVAMIHTALARATHAIASADKSAYSLLGSALGKVMTWFNSAVKNWADVKVAGFIPIIFSDGQCTATLHTLAVCQVYLNEEVGSSLVAGHFFVGTSKTSMLLSKAATVTAGSHATNGANPFTTLTAGEKYYWQFRADTADPCEGANSGIYHFTAT